jgi:hypothetical protein
MVLLVVVMGLRTGAYLAPEEVSQDLLEPRSHSLTLKLQYTGHILSPEQTVRHI